MTAIIAIVKRSLATRIALGPHREPRLHDVHLGQGLERVAAPAVLDQRDLPKCSGAQHRHKLQVRQLHHGHAAELKWRSDPLGVQHQDLLCRLQTVSALYARCEHSYGHALHCQAVKRDIICTAHSLGLQNLSCWWLSTAGCHAHPCDGHRSACLRSAGFVRGCLRVHQLLQRPQQRVEVLTVQHEHIDVRQRRDRRRPHLRKCVSMLRCAWLQASV